MSSNSATLNITPAHAAANWRGYQGWLSAFHEKQIVEPNVPLYYVECRGNRPWERDVFIPTEDAKTGYWVAEDVFVAWFCSFCLSSGQPIPSFCYKQVGLKGYENWQGYSTAPPPKEPGPLRARLFGKAPDKHAGVPPPGISKISGLPAQYRVRLHQAFLTAPFPESRDNSPLPEPVEEPDEFQEEEEQEEIQEEVDTTQDDDDSEDEGPPFIETPETSPGDLVTFSFGFGLNDLSRSYFENLGSPSLGSKRKVSHDEDDEDESFGQPVRKRQRI